MKIYILTALILFTLAGFSQTNFSNGYNNGYKKGYCQNQGIGCISPLPPIAPIPNIGENINSYVDGYNRGFTDGLNYQKLSHTTSDRERYETSEAKYVQDKMAKTDLNDAIAVSIMLYNFKDEAVKLGDTNPERQIQLCKVGLSINPKDVEFLMLIGRVYARHYNDDAKALYYLEQAYSYDTNRETGVENLIRAIKNGTVERINSNHNYSNNTMPKNKYSPNQIGTNFKTLPIYSGKIYTNETIPVLDKPDLINSNSLGNIVGTSIEIIRKENDKFYLVKSGNIMGYVYVGYIIKAQQSNH